MASPAPPKPKLFIPWIGYNHTVNMEHSLSMIRLLLYCQAHQIAVTVYPIGFESLISRARNAAVAAFLSDPDATHLLFIDTDIGFAPEDVLKLIFADRPIVCSAYAKKFLDAEKLRRTPDRLELCTQASVHLTPEAVAVFTAPSTSAAAAAAPLTDSRRWLAECYYATTGFLLVRREVFTVIAARFPERKYVNDIDAHAGLNPEYFYDFFPVAIHPLSRRYESEDYGFSRLAREAGYTIYCSTDVTLTHYGQMGFPCNLYKQLTS